MAEYIDRKALMKKSFVVDGHRVVSYLDIIGEPAADVVPVVHGRWVVRPVNVGTPTTDLFCSECDFPAWKYKYNYCPNCGAKMDGGVEGG